VSFSAGDLLQLYAPRKVWYEEGCGCSSPENGMLPTSTIEANLACFVLWQFARIVALTLSDPFRENNAQRSSSASSPCGSCSGGRRRIEGIYRMKPGESSLLSP
jgi:hypothetical protein